MSIEFWITTRIVVASPGTGVIYTIATGLGRGERASVLAAFACTLGIIPHLVAMRDRIVSNAVIMTWMRRSFAAAFGALASKLALTDR